MKKRWVSLFLAISLTFCFTSFGFADTLQDKKDQLQESKDNISDLKNQISDVKGEKEDVLGELNKIEAQVDKVQDDITDIRKQIDSTKKNVQNTEKELNRAIKEYNEQRELYENRVKAIYMSGPSGYLEIMLSSDGFSDFFARADMVKKIIEYDRNVLQEMADKQEKINQKKTKLESEQRRLVSLDRSLAAKKAELDSANANKKKYYDKLNSDLKALEKSLNKEIADSNAIAEEIKRLTSGSSEGSYSGSKTGILRVSDIGYTPKVTSPFGMRWHPVLQQYAMHTGIDIGVPSGTPVYAMSSGKVIIAQKDPNASSYGKYVVIDHGGGITSLYAHNSEVFVSVGQSVEKGQMITKSGSTGRSTGPHLHFEVRQNGTPINPIPYYIVGQ